MDFAVFVFYLIIYLCLLTEFCATRFGFEGPGRREIECENAYTKQTKATERTLV